MSRKRRSGYERRRDEKRRDDRGDSGAGRGRGAPQDDARGSRTPLRARGRGSAPRRLRPTSAPAEEAPAEAAAEEAPAAEAAAELSRIRRTIFPGRSGAGCSARGGRTRPARSRRPRSGPPRARRRASSKAAERRKERAAAKAKKDRPAPARRAAERDSNAAKVRQGIVVSNKGDKSITVRIDIARRHPTYEKIVRRSRTLHAHDERNEAGEGDVVRVVETRPLSKTKRWRLVDVVEKAR